ncbi:MAG: DUF3108 domain-containing protein [Gammaproteobacteria bacterium]|nr:MAG: DUF3108 domain-containing protein [Gammaproteobacteria bacterium]
MRHWLCALLLATATGMALAQDLPDEYRATYTASKGGLVGGRVKSRLEHRAGGRLYFTNDAEPAGLLAIVRLFADVRVNENTLMEPDGQGQGHYRPLEYHYLQKGGDRERSGEYHFDWPRHRVTGKVLGEPFALEEIPDDTQDRLSINFRIMMDLRHDRLQECYPLVNRGKMDRYCFARDGKETIETAFGPLETMRLRRTDDPKRKTRTWYAPALDWLPVRIEQIDEKGSRLVMEIESLEGIPHPEPESESLF